MNAPSAELQALLLSLQHAQAAPPDGSLTLDAGTLTGAAGAALLGVFDELQLTSFTLTSDVVLPASVEGDDLVVSGAHQGLTLTLSFQDTGGGDIAVRALFQSARLATITDAFSALPADFYAGITMNGAAPSVLVPGVHGPLTLANAVYGLEGTAAPASGFVTYGLQPHVEGQVSPPSGAKDLSITLPTSTSGFVLAPSGSAAWSFDDLGWLVPDLGLVAAIPSILPAHALGLRSFSLSLWPNAPGLSSVTIDVADGADPSQALFSAADGKVELADVSVSFDLTYDPHAPSLALAGSGCVTGNFALGRIALAAEIMFPFDQGVWSISARPDLDLPDLGDIAHLLSAGSLDDLLPADLAKVGGFTLRFLRVAVDAQSLALVEFTFWLSSTNTWSLVPSNALTLESLQIQMTLDANQGVTGRVGGAITVGQSAQVHVELRREQSTDPWQLDVISPLIALPSIGELKTLAGGADLGSHVQAAGLDTVGVVIENLHLGLALPPPKLTDLGMTVALTDTTAPANPGDPPAPSLDWKVIPGVLTLTDFSVGFQLAWNAAGELSTTVAGAFTANALTFDVTFGQEFGADTFVARYAPDAANTETICVPALIATLSPSVAKLLPSDLSLDVQGASLVYVGATGTKKYLFEADLGVHIDLSGLPVIGSVFSNTVSAIDGFRVYLASDAFWEDDVAHLPPDLAGRLLPTDTTVTTAPHTKRLALARGLGFRAVLTLDGAATVVPPPPGDAPANTPESATSAAPSADTTGATWLNVQKTLGPVNIARIGGALHDKRLWFYLDATIAVGVLSMTLDGLGVGLSLDTGPAFAIRGLSLSYESGPIELSGGFLADQAMTTFAGEAVLKTELFTVSAVGEYSDADGYKSAFLFAMLDAPLGGPEFFFVTGLAAGFGYNSQVRLPTVDTVKDHILLQAALPGGGSTGLHDVKSDPGQVLQKLMGSGDVFRQDHETWLAAGVRFSSFDVIDTFAFFLVEFGSELEIAVIGLSKITLPPPPEPGAQAPNPFALIELALEVKVLPAQGEFSACAVITPASFLLDPNCKPTGGFAFYAWFGDNPHAGEFVLTVGGYHPHFTPKPYYPNVQRLGFHWPLSSELTLDGDAYFALTPSAVMAGGRLAAVFHLGPIRAWFIACLDALIEWAPFHFEVTLGISIGVSARIHLLFVTVTLTIELGCNLDVWGPKFGGRAHISYYILSFSISFGASHTDRPALDGWGAFAASLLPPTPLSSVIRAGLVAQPPAPVGTAPKYSVVRRDQLRLAITSAIPATKIQAGANTLSGPETVSVRPLSTVLQSTALTIVVTLCDDASDKTSHFAVTPLVSRVPAAQWGDALGAQGMTLARADELLDGVLTGALLTVAKQSPLTPNGDDALTLSTTEALAPDDIDPESTYVVETPAGGHAAPIVAPDPSRALREDAGAMDTRKAILAALAVWGMHPGDDGPLADDPFAGDPSRLLRGTPLQYVA